MDCVKEVNIKEAKARFSQLLHRVAFGEEFTITRRRVPIARLVPIPPNSARRKLGIYRDLMTIPDDFDAPLPDEILNAFEGKSRQKKA